MRKLVLLTILLAMTACRQREQAVTDTPGTHGYGTQGKTETRAAETTATGVDVGAKMPEYSALWLDGSKFDLASRRERVVLLNVWATWCAPCREEIPELQTIHAKYGPRGFEVIGVSVDEGGADAVREFVAEQKMTYPVVLDAEGKLATVLQTSMLPTSVLLDRDGKVVWKKIGAIPANDRELIQAIEKTL